MSSNLSEAFLISKAGNNGLVLHVCSAIGYFVKNAVMLGRGSALFVVGKLDLHKRLGYQNNAGKTGKDRALHIDAARAEKGFNCRNISKYILFLNSKLNSKWRPLNSTPTALLPKIIGRRLR